MSSRSDDPGVSLDTRVRVPYAPRLLSEWSPQIRYTPARAIMWNQREDQRLMNSYKRIPRKALMRLFPDRTWLAIVSRAYLLKIPRKGRWYTPEEDRLLLALYHDMDLTYAQMSEYFPHRDRFSLRMRICTLRKRRGGE